MPIFRIKEKLLNCQLLIFINEIHFYARRKTLIRRNSCFEEIKHRIFHYLNFKKSTIGQPDSKNRNGNINMAENQQIFFYKTDYIFTI